MWRPCRESPGQFFKASETQFATHGEVASSGVVVLVSRRHELARGDDRMPMEPDLPIELSWQDYAAGRDPLLEAALTP